MRNNMSIFHTKHLIYLTLLGAKFGLCLWNSKELDFYNVDLEALCANAFTTPGELNVGLQQ